MQTNSPEEWELLDWTGQLASQVKLNDTLLNWKSERDARLEKLKQEGAQL
jgi:hypothetical protein